MLRDMLLPFFESSFFFSFSRELNVTYKVRTSLKYEYKDNDLYHCIALHLDGLGLSLKVFFLADTTSIVWLTISMSVVFIAHYSSGIKLTMLSKW